ncbi:MAG: hypothetical protein J5I47_04820 [Vicingus serpentipes]|nr:hypothetical protein [Vicingus serpentipes]
MIKNKIQKISSIFNPVINLPKKLKIFPNHVTTISFIINIVGSVIFIIGAEAEQRDNLSYVGWGGFAILLAGIMNVIGYKLTNKPKISSRFNFFYKSFLERYGELLIFLGVCYYLVSYNYFFSSLFSFIALIGSMMMNYIKARAEGLNIKWEVGFIEKPMKIITLGFFAMICGIFNYFIGSHFSFQYLPLPIFETIIIFTVPIAIVAIFSNIVAVKGIMYCKRELTLNRK